MSAARPAVGFDTKKYGALFAPGIARTITTDAENQAAIEELEAYSFPQNPASEEEAYFEVLPTFIEQYEKATASLLLRDKFLLTEAAHWR